MTPAALYLRYSSDRQNERSPEDQEAMLRPFMERLDFKVVAVYVDRAKSGASIHERTDFQRMLADARLGRFKAVCAETTSRYGRDEEDRAAARKRLEFAGVVIMTQADGVVSRVVDGIKAVMDAHQLEDLKRMIRRGMAAVVRDGRHAGGLAYGYRAAPGRAGVLEIVEDEAAVVRRIYAAYIAGATPRSIAAALNAENIAAPRGGYWRASTINGHTRRHTGILQCELYCGRLVWNRARRVRDPDTNRRVWRHNPETDWQRNEAPHLRILPDDVFDAAQRLRQARSKGPHGGRKHHPKRLLSGLLRCGCCNAGMSKKDINHGRPRIVCTRMMESRSCDNRQRFYVDDIERHVIAGLRDHLGSPAAIAYFVRCYNEERRKAAAGGAGLPAELRAEFADVERRIDRAVAAVIDNRITAEEAEAHLPALRGRRAELAQRLAAAQSPRVVTLRPAAVDGYLRDLARLDQVIAGDIESGNDTIAKAIRPLIETVTIMPGRPPGIIVKGQLASLLEDDDAPDGPQPGGKANPVIRHQ